MEQLNAEDYLFRCKLWNARHHTHVHVEYSTHSWKLATLGYYFPLKINNETLGTTIHLNPAKKFQTFQTYVKTFDLVCIFGYCVGYSVACRIYLDDDAILIPPLKHTMVPWTQIGGSIHVVDNTVEHHRWMDHFIYVIIWFCHTNSDTFLDI